MLEIDDAQYEAANLKFSRESEERKSLNACSLGRMLWKHSIRLFENAYSVDHISVEQNGKVEEGTEGIAAIRIDFLLTFDQVFGWFDS